MRAAALAAFLGLGACGGSGGGRAPAFELRVLGPGTKSVALGRGPEVLLALGVTALEPGARLGGLSVELSGRFGRRSPLRGARLVLDRDGDGRAGPAEPELAAGRFERRSRSFVLELSFARAPALGRPETWLLTAEASPAGMGSAFTLRAALRRPTGKDGRPAPVRAIAAARAPALAVEVARFAADHYGESGACLAAASLPEPQRIAELRIGARRLRFDPWFPSPRAGEGVFTFVLPPLLPGARRLTAFDAAGKLVAALALPQAFGAGKGPARFADASLTALPRDHAFSQDATVADLDLDGRPDLVVPVYAKGHDRVLRNLGGGRFADVSQDWLPPLGADTVHIEAADFDGDGDVDLALGVEGGRNRLYLNDGTGRMQDATEGRLPPDGDFTEDLRAADLDGDGDLDLVAANLVDPADPRRGGRLRLYLNRGDGRFLDGTAGRLPDVPVRSYDVEFADFDGDGDLDLFSANYGEPCTAYRNAGNAVFVAANEADSGIPQAKAFHTSATAGDVDGDGRPDVLVGVFQGKSFVLRNLGGFRFARVDLGVAATSTYDVALGDLDGDGDLDAFLANSSNPSFVLLNDGKGGFSQAPPADFSSPDDKAYDVELFDADGDGALDIFVSVWGDRRDVLYLARPKTPPAGSPRLLRIEPNYGPPATGAWITLRGKGFVKGMSGTIGGVPLRDLSVWDAKTANAYAPPAPPGEVDLTLSIPGKGSVRAPKAFGYEPPAAGAFVDVSPLVLGREQAPSAAVAAGDLNGDGYPEILFGDSAKGARLRIGKASGVMGYGSLPAMQASANDLDLADFDGDGKLDLLVTAAGKAPLLLRGLGAARFAPPRKLPAPAGGAEEAAVGDLDGDKDLDLVFATAGAEVVLRNDGGLRFTQLAEKAFAQDDTRSVALGDLDGDGDLDLVCANFKGAARVYLNGGRGVFSAAVGAVPARPLDQSYGAALADVDGDGDLDLAIANGGAQVNRLFFNDGKARFSEAPVGVFRPALGGGAHVIFGDVDLDGDPDLFSSHFWGSNHLYFWNEGRLAERPGVLPTTPGGFAAACFADLDRDGDLDLVLAAFWGGSRVLRNPTR